jgi:hypothetical protein
MPAEAQSFQDGAIKCGNLLKKSAGQTATGLGYGGLPAESEMDRRTHNLPSCLDLRTGVEFQIVLS